MARRRLVWKLFPAYVVLVVASTAGVGAWSLRAIGNDQGVAMERDLRARVRLVASEIDAGPADPGRLQAIVDRAGDAVATRFTVIAPDGTVLADSEPDPRTLESHARHDDVVEAMRSGQSRVIRMPSSSSARPDTFHATVRAGAGAVRGVLPATSLERSHAVARNRLVTGGLVLVALASALGFLHARWLTAPLREIRRGAERFAAGDLSRRIPVPDTEEAAAVADALNRMATQLVERLGTIERQAGEQAAVLSSMTEGVFAVDDTGVLLSANGSAVRLLGSAASAGRSLREVRTVALERLVATVLESGEHASAEVLLPDPAEPDAPDRIVQAHCSVLTGAGVRRGAVVVLEDVTRLRQLEAVRREFVANVSHELKTPVTSLKGFIETLREGALRDPERAERFLDILGRQADRLSAIIDDLLMLSRLEREGRQTEIPLHDGDVSEVLSAAVHQCEPAAQARGVLLDVRCDPGLRALLNPPLVEQALVNLVDNAVQYSEPGARVDVSARIEGPELVLEVRDRGCGIERDHLPRLFERFYRVDRARSRKAGGTGLGLSIVKHIAQAHGGAVSVESEVGKGSRFTLRIPRG